MRTETEIKTIPIYNTIEDEHGEFIKVEKIGEQEVATTEIFADEGKVFVEKSTGKVLSEHITLGTEDSAENYSEIPIAEMVME